MEGEAGQGPFHGGLPVGGVEGHFDPAEGVRVVIVGQEEANLAGGPFECAGAQPEPLQKTRAAALPNRLRRGVNLQDEETQG
jgi:hypothetical protein